MTEDERKGFGMLMRALLRIALDIGWRWDGERWLDGEGKPVAVCEEEG